MGHQQTMSAIMIYIDNAISQRKNNKINPIWMEKIKKLKAENNEAKSLKGLLHKSFTWFFKIPK